MTGTAQVTVTNSTISGNTSRTMGGGIQLNSLTLNATPSLAGALNIRNSTIAFNSSGIIATTLASAITNNATSMTVVDATGITTGMNLQIDSEIVNVTTVVGNTLTITRAQQGTAAVAHNAAASVYNGGGGGVSFRTTTGTGTPNVTLTSTIVSNNIHVARRTSGVGPRRRPS